ncbi:biliverdin-producing heme oxygenase [Sphingomonas sp. ASY06-1R]|uniref:biliverdin-producing heme oxygenase n=1 Tax=Sphingomonas sp. ASY06-1R TaxID=3445771 RepID=UPI003FA307E8
MTLRTATAQKHELVDAAFSNFDLTDSGSYGRFLTAHARALPAVERALSARSGLPPFEPRTPLLQQDLEALGLAMPEPYEMRAPDNEAGAFGALYVIEGSRLGGSLLAGEVPPDLPRAYLSAVHPTGAWRAFGEALDHASRRGSADWIDQAIAAADATFDLYADAAREP